MSSKTAYFYQNSSGALILTRTARTISLKLQVSVNKPTFWSAHKDPALKVWLKVVATGVEQLFQLFTAPTPKKSLLVLASAPDTKKQAPRAENLSRSRRAKLLAVSRLGGQRGHLLAEPGRERRQLFPRQHTAPGGGRRLEFPSQGDLRESE